MLNYTTTTIVNDSASIVSNADKKLFRVKFGPELVNVAGRHEIKLVGKTGYAAAKKATANVTLPTGTEVKRIAIYVRLRNNNNPYFSNDWTFKGKPLYIEFNGGATAEEVVTITKKFMLAQYGYNLVDVAAVEAAAGTVTNGVTLYDAAGSQVEASAIVAGGTYFKDAAQETPAVKGVDYTEPVSAGLLITAHDQWEMFMDQDSLPGVKVQKLVTVDMAGNEIKAGDVANSPTHEEFVEDTSATVTLDNGNEAFGDFAHIVKDLRLPTAANLRWQGIAQGDVFGDEPNDDKPLPTGKYTQYTIQYTSKRGVGQQTVMGGVGESITVHVFYVESGAVEAFDAALTAVGVTGVTDADPV